MEPTIVHANGVDLCVQAFGEPTDPPVLLVMGAGASMDCWEDDLCARLAAGARYVVRYDHRDTGQSTSYPPGAPGYTGDDLVADSARPPRRARRGRARTSSGCRWAARSPSSWRSTTPSAWPR